MGSNPINLTIRFLLELAALLSLGIWGWAQSESWLKFIFAFGVPIISAIAWGVFAVPDDPSRSGSAPVPIPGVIRLVIELAIFALAVLSLRDLGYIKLSWGLALVVAVHYIISYDRIFWLIRQKGKRK